MLEALHIYHSFYVRMDRYPVGSQALDTVDGLKRIGFGSKKHCQLPLATVELADLTHRIKSSEKAIPFEITRVSCACLQKADSLRNGLATLATKDWVQLVASALQWLQRRSYRISLIWLQHSWKQVMKDMTRYIGIIWSMQGVARESVQYRLQRFCPLESCAEKVEDPTNIH